MDPISRSSVPSSSTHLIQNNDSSMPPAYGSCEALPPIMSSITDSSFTKSLLSRRNDYLIPKRYIFSLLSFTACCLAVSYNMNLSIAIVSMIKKETEPTNTSLSFNASDFVEIKNMTDDGILRLAWSSKTMGIALGAVYYGQLVSFIPGGRMAELYGGKNMLIACTLTASIATLMSPVAAMWCPFTFVMTRVLVGIGTGPIIPIVYNMLGRWIPEHERSFHASFIISGYGIGSFLAVIISGAICSTSFLGGWPSVFYVGAFSGVIWSFICVYMMSESPEDHPSIGEKEISYIKQGLGLHNREKVSKIPWKEMAFSIPLWALAIGFFGQFWLLGFFSTVHAMYMGTVLNLPVAKNGVLSCLPHLLRAFATCLASYPVDLILKRKLVSVGFIRKAATIINTVVSCGALLGITYVGRDVGSTTFLFILAGVLGEFVTFGVCMGCIDIAPNLSGTVSGILNIIGVFPFFIIPSLVGWLTNYENSIEKWQHVFHATIIIVTVCTVFFTVFGDLRPQSWGVSPENNNRNSEKNSKKDERETLVLSGKSEPAYSDELS